MAARIHEVLFTGGMAGYAASTIFRRQITRASKETDERPYITQLIMK